MKDKVIFFILGAVLATIAFFVGSYTRNNFDEITCERLRVSKSILVGKDIKSREPIIYMKVLPHVPEASIMLVDDALKPDSRIDISTNKDSVLPTE